MDRVRSVAGHPPSRRFAFDRPVLCGEEVRPDAWVVGRSHSTRGSLALVPIQMRDRLGRHVRVARSEISHAALISSFEPPQFVVRLNDLLVVGTNGRCLLRLPEPDYGTEAIERLVGTLGVHQPHERISTRRQFRREFPGAYAFDYLAVGIFIIVILAMALALASFNGLLR